MADLLLERESLLLQRLLQKVHLLHMFGIVLFEEVFRPYVVPLLAFEPIGGYWPKNVFNKLFLRTRLFHSNCYCSCYCCEFKCLGDALSTIESRTKTHKGEPSKKGLYNREVCKRSIQFLPWTLSFDI